MSKIKEWMGYDYVSEDLHTQINLENSNMITLKGDATVLTEENYEVLIAILEEMRNCLNVDMNIEDLSDRAGDLLSRDYRRLRTIQEQLALTMEVINQWKVS